MHFPLHTALASPQIATCSIFIFTRSVFAGSDTFSSTCLWKSDGHGLPFRCLFSLFSPFPACGSRGVNRAGLLGSLVSPSAAALLPSPSGDVRFCGCASRPHSFRLVPGPSITWLWRCHPQHECPPSFLGTAWGLEGLHVKWCCDPPPKPQPWAVAVGGAELWWEVVGKGPVCAAQYRGHRARVTTCDTGAQSSRH